MFVNVTLRTRNGPSHGRRGRVPPRSTARLASNAAPPSDGRCGEDAGMVWLRARCSGRPHWHELVGTILQPITNRNVCRYAFRDLSVLMDRGTSRQEGQHNRVRPVSEALGAGCTIALGGWPVRC